jgi:hypothetical protein
LNFWTLILAQPWKQRIFLIRSMFWRGLAEVSQSSLQSPTGFFRGRSVNYNRDSFQRGEEHLDSPVAVRQQACGVREVMNLCSYLDRHVLSAASNPLTF